MKNKTPLKNQWNFRTLHGKLFAALLGKFGADYVGEIEDAIQNAFYKALKSWKPDKLPDNKENWLFIVAKNDVLNQLKKRTRWSDDKPDLTKEQHEEPPNEDLRLKTMLFLAAEPSVSAQMKVIFILKNIFGLHIREISVATLLSQEAIYKGINRAKKSFSRATQRVDFDATFERTTTAEIHIVEEILYAVFNIGFDSFNQKVESIINEDLCLEAISLGKILWTSFSKITTKNLLALCCFHLARIPAKIRAGKLIPFLKQQTKDWNKDFLGLGFHYLEKPQTLNKYYLEALIVSKHMTATLNDDTAHWSDIVTLYQLLLSIASSPIAKLNLCYCLYKAGRIGAAKTLLRAVEKELPNEHIYLSLVKINMLKDVEEKSKTEEAMEQLLTGIHQEIRRVYILENMSTNL
ncbi:MAG: DUF6596 domain-containing protein [Bacteroidota bacterium]